MSSVIHMNYNEKLQLCDHIIISMQELILEYMNIGGENYHCLPVALSVDDSREIHCITDAMNIIWVFRKDIANQEHGFF